MDRQMNGRSCAMPTCSRQSRSRGWCDMHYRRSLRHGSPWTPGGSYRDREEAFLGRTEPLPSKCLDIVAETGQSPIGCFPTAGTQPVTITNQPEAAK